MNILFMAVNISRLYAYPYHRLYKLAFMIALSSISSGKALLFALAEIDDVLPEHVEFKDQYNIEHVALLHSQV